MRNTKGRYVLTDTRGIQLIQIMGNYVQKFVQLKRKEAERDWDRRKEKLIDKNYLRRINQLQLETLQSLLEQINFKKLTF